FAGSGLALIFAQRIVLGDLKTTLRWIGRHWVAVLMTIILASAMALIVLGLGNRYWLAFSVTLLLAFLIATVDRIKHENALTRFLWSDLFKTNDPGKFKELIGHYVRPTVFGPIILLLTTGNIATWLLLDPAPFSRGLAGSLPRLACFFLGLLVLVIFRYYAVWVNLPFCRRFLHLAEFTNQDYDGNVEEHGTLLAFCGHITTGKREQDQPTDYAAENADAIRRTLAAAVAGASAAAATEAAAATGAIAAARGTTAYTPTAAGPLPTIIVLAIESLWDITQVPGLTFTTDPLEPLRADYAGEARVNWFAGLTSNTEFEFLTSLSLRFMHDSACPFIKIDRPVPALPAHLREIGYTTTAFHSFTRTFYARDKVYPRLGFDQFFGVEDFEAAGQAEKKGWYMGDAALVQPIINQLEQPGPQLVFAVTMQNHGPYTPDRYAESEYEPEATPTVAPELALSAGDERAIINYVQGVRDSGKMYRAIRDYCQQLDRPVMILSFGDHLPGIGDHSGFRIFLRSGLVHSIKDDAMFSVPVFCWTNPAGQALGLSTDLGLPAREAGPSGSVPSIGFNTLAPRLLRCAQLPTTPIQQVALAAEARQQKARSQTDDDLLRAYAWLQYDWLWGQGLIDPKSF
ncbi:MAG: phosphoglycerol transferase, partial [Firmicutes bacterium]|nr:phosphoglycerol transferase [Bacillota bacterium]